ncbi:hypothetical protein chiPu_0016643 [Chiloscyllium punctatum]|uniref:Uncharacterized protein n=1 Tax=Chiloscyllium punctatum TaxID=137246 RepID=A0A401T686_CHIPU|nr:hypothetical protein [Chiloscyllium punctatum]
MGVEVAKCGVGDVAGAEAVATKVVEVVERVAEVMSEGVKVAAAVAESTEEVEVSFRLGLALVSAAADLIAVEAAVVWPMVASAVVWPVVAEAA